MLTMSATPIPCTLQFSLMGARDLSNLNTPPANRRPVETMLSQTSPQVIREAVNYELSRGGRSTSSIVASRISRVWWPHPACEVPDVHRRGARPTGAQGDRADPHRLRRTRV